MREGLGRVSEHSITLCSLRSEPHGTTDTAPKAAIQRPSVKFWTFLLTDGLEYHCKLGRYAPYNLGPSPRGKPQNAWSEKPDIAGLPDHAY